MTTLEALVSGNAFLIAIVGFFLKRTLNDIAGDLRQALLTISSHTTSIAVQEARISRLEADLAAQSVKYDDLAGFLQSEGFRKRDGK